MKKALIAISVVLLLIGLYWAITGITSSTREMQVSSFLQWATFLRWQESRVITGIVTAFVGIAVFVVSRVVANR